MGLGKFTSRDPKGDPFQGRDVKPIKKKKELSPADKGFEAARHDNDTKQIYEQEKNSFKTVPVDKEKERKLEILKDPTLGKKEEDKQFNNLFKLITDQQKTIDLLREDIKVLANNIAEQPAGISEAEGEFVENVETEQTGGGVMLDYIMLKHTDVVIVIGIDSIGIYESFEDFQDGIEPIAFVEIEEMEKIALEEKPENVSDKKVDHALRQWHNDNDLDSATEQSARSWIEKFNSMHELNQFEEEEVWQEILKELNSGKK